MPSGMTCDLGAVAKHPNAAIRYRRIYYPLRTYKPKPETLGNERSHRKDRRIRRSNLRGFASFLERPARIDGYRLACFRPRFCASVVNSGTSGSGHRYQSASVSSCGFGKLRDEAMLRAPGTAPFTDSTPGPFRVGPGVLSVASRGRSPHHITSAVNTEFRRRLRSGSPWCEAGESGFPCACSACHSGTFFRIPDMTHKYRQADCRNGGLA